ncbi:winged helix-turn-helix domain-containing protein [Sphingomonas sp. NSE70-1]|uniref:Winged helix-turn-helix domain-containing protein n=1 Tax=Sphingomonas caseinilyticus TaxID=2908205 RepID=A0ABT0RTE5_9SPHN|nr:winged helix-turn-helix domain-containing protein [Sphingomonas caseinilyticus]MCL6698269.1 winged helix-turn-helix domain-containing protein [Sphingomonas caseinilyticus]
MNLADRMLTTSELVARGDFHLGDVIVSPSNRTMTGPDGSVVIEPRVLQVLVVLADAAGTVVTRETLFGRCWGGLYVGDDSLNRTIAAIRKAASDVGSTEFDLKTIPRTGYKLTGEVREVSPQPTDETHRPISRRLVIGGGVAAAAIGGGALWWATGRSNDPRFDALMARGDDAFRDGTAFEQWDTDATNRPKLIEIYEEATRLEPDSAKAWGLLAYFRTMKADAAPANVSPRLITEASATIQHALEIDANEPNARVATYLLEGRMLNWIDRDRRLREILAKYPDNLPATIELMPLLQAAGYTRESWTWNERILSASPLARPYLVIRALKLWILGRIRESDNVIDRVRGLWPEYVFGNWVRFILFALSDRPRAARGMLDSAAELMGGSEWAEMWRTALEAIETRSVRAIAATEAKCLEQAKLHPIVVNDLVMVLCAMGRVDAAFEVTNGFLLWRGKIVSADQADGKAMDDYSRRMTQWLFTPPVAAMRADPRFLKLCDEFGLTDYWRERGVQPDYQRFD